MKIIIAQQSNRLYIDPHLGLYIINKLPKISLSMLYILVLNLNSHSHLIIKWKYIQERVKKVLKLWKDNRVFDEEACARAERALQGLGDLQTQQTTVCAHLCQPWPAPFIVLILLSYCAIINIYIFVYICIFAHSAFPLNIFFPRSCWNRSTTARMKIRHSAQVQLQTRPKSLCRLLFPQRQCQHLLLLPAVHPPPLFHRAQHPIAPHSIHPLEVV